MTLYILFKLGLLAVALWLWFTISAKCAKGQEIPAFVIALASSALVGFIYMQGWLP